ncbi:MAG: hypothetical protein LC650_05030, partial [Actinobacteria bacterium]|nr:hypothetical protein [Actinomycetota bacterium]
CGTFTSQPQKIVTQTDGFTVVDSQGLLTSSEALQSASVSLIFNNSTKTYSFTWSDTENVVTNGCLYVYKTANYVKTTNYSACSNGAAGSLIYTLTGNVTNTAWSAQGVLETNTDYSTYTYSGPDVSYLTSITNWGAAGVFWGLLLLLGIVLTSAQTASTVVFSAVGSLVVLIVLGVVAGGGSVVAGLIIMGVLILYKIRT